MNYRQKDTLNETEIFRPTSQQQLTDFERTTQQLETGIDMLIAKHNPKVFKYSQNKYGFIDFNLQPKKKKGKNGKSKRKNMKSRDRSSSKRKTLDPKEE